MKQMGWLVVVGFVLGQIVAADVAAADIYRWTDAGGQPHFTTDLSSVPPAYRAAAQATAGAKPKSGVVNLMPTRPARRAEPGAPPAASAPTHRDGSGRFARSAGERDLVGGHDEAWWRSQATRFRDEIGVLEQEVEACKDVKAPSRYNHRTGRRMKRQHYERGKAAARRCAQNKSTLGVKRLQLDNFAERARRQGVPPGWMRTL